jgi:hypothetical protein
VLQSAVAFGVRAGEVLVDTFEADAQRLIVQFSEAKPTVTQLTFTRQR